MWSGLLEPGMTTTPRCKFHRKVTWAEVTPWAFAMAEITGSPSSSEVYPRPPKGYQPCTVMPNSWIYGTTSDS